MVKGLKAQEQQDKGAIAAALEQVTCDATLDAVMIAMLSLLATFDCRMLCGGAM